MAMTPQELVNMLGSLTLFADLTRPQLEQVAHSQTPVGSPHAPAPAHTPLSHSPSKRHS